MSTKEIFNILPYEIRKEIEDVNDYSNLQEIRIKVNKPLILQIANKEKITCYIPTLEDLKIILNRMSNFSIYAFEEEIKQGYITIKGGHRVGICGDCVIENNRVKTIKNVASINIRICKEIKGCSNNVMPYLINDKDIFNTIIISPPKCGKTTLIRDIARNISEGVPKYNFTGKKVCIVDERSEIAACYNGVPQLDVGLRTDILDNCPKYMGIMMAIRSMSPDVIICDEIGTYDDMNSILMALNCGVRLITTIHGYDINDLYDRDVFKKVMNNNVFDRAIILSGTENVGTIKYIYDLSKKEIIWGD